MTNEAGSEHVDEEEEEGPEKVGSSGSSGSQPPVPAESSEFEGRIVPDCIGGAADHWTVSSTAVVRHHMTPRMYLYVTNEAECPVPMRFLDVVRSPITNIEDNTDAFVQDVWNTEVPLPEDTRPVSGEWTGNTMFRMLRPEPPAGFVWDLDKLVKSKETIRPDVIDPLLWSSLSRPQRAKDIALWQVVNAVRIEARAKRGRAHVPPEEKEEWPRITKENKEPYALPPAPAMTILDEDMDTQIVTLTKYVAHVSGGQRLSENTTASDKSTLCHAVVCTP